MNNLLITINRNKTHPHSGLPEMLSGVSDTAKTVACGDKVPSLATITCTEGKGQQKVGRENGYFSGSQRV